jgi:hypothetical protein
MDARIVFLAAYTALLVYFFVLPFDGFRTSRNPWSGVIGPALLLLTFLAWSRIQGNSARPLAGNGSVRVWANTRSGFYYCPGTKFYGKLTPGKFMIEGEAVQSGYQPSLGETCR